MVGLKLIFKQELQVAQLVETLATLDVELGAAVRDIAEDDVCALGVSDLKLVAKDLSLDKIEDARCDWDLANVDGFSIELALLLEFSRSGGSSGWLDPDPRDPPVLALPWGITIPPPTIPPPPP